MVLMNVDIHHAYGVLRFINTFYQYHKKTNFILNNSNKILVDLHWITLSKKCYPSSATENDLGNHSSTSACQWYEERNWKAIPFINFKVELEIWFAYIYRNQHHLGSAARLSHWLTAVLSIYIYIYIYISDKLDFLHKHFICWQKPTIIRRNCDPGTLQTVWLVDGK